MLPERHRDNGMDEQITIRVGGVGLLLTRADAASVAAQLAGAGIAAEAAGPGQPLVIGDDHPMWSLHSGGDRHAGPDWDDGDERLAQTQDRLPPLTAVFHEIRSTTLDVCCRLRIWPSFPAASCRVLASSRVPCRGT